jgi:hypothetical protein
LAEEINEELLRKMQTFSSMIFTPSLEILESASLAKVNASGRMPKVQEMGDEITQMLDFGKMTLGEGLILFKALLLNTVLKLVPEGDDTPVTYAKALLAETLQPLTGPQFELDGSVPTIPPASSVIPLPEGF